MNNELRKLSFCDCTLYQGEKSPDMSFREKIELCRLLDKLNVDCISMREIHNTRIDSLLIKSVSQAVRHAQIAVPVILTDDESVPVTWAALQEAEKARLQVPAPLSSVQMEYLYHLKPAALKDKTIQMIKKCKEFTQNVELIAMDATRSDQGFLREVVSEAIQSGVSIITFCDTAGSMLPEEIYSFFHSLYHDLPELKNIAVSFSCADTLNLADACAIAAIECGINEIKAASFSTDSISLKNIVQIIHAKGKSIGVSDQIGIEKIGLLTSQIAKLCQAGLGHNTRNKDLSKSESEHGNLVINTHESSDSIKNTIIKLGYDLSEEDYEKIWHRINQLSEKKDTVSVIELEAIIATEAMQVPPAYSNIQYVINSGSNISAMSHMKLNFHGKALEGISTGDGSIDAAFKSIETATGRHFELDDFQIQSISEGREAMGETLVKLRSEGKLYSGKGLSTDIVGASIMAYINALNKIIYEEEEA